MHIVMLAAENDALPNGKVGGIGDVLRDVPPSLARGGHSVSVILPSYGLFHEQPDTEKITLLSVNHEGVDTSVAVYRLSGASQDGVNIFVLDHPLFSLCGKGRIYCNDPSDAPFASDARKFSLYCRAAAELLLSSVIAEVDAIHLHDWHAALFALLCRYDPLCKPLAAIRLVYSIHNLAIQGIRPLQNPDSSLQSWYPDLQTESSIVADPRWPHCINPVAAAVRLSDAIHTVSPSYAADIVCESRVDIDGFYGGEGLEQELLLAQQQGRLFGILNGCDYSSKRAKSQPWPELLQTIKLALKHWLTGSRNLLTADYVADNQLSRWEKLPQPTHILTSIGRLTEQKARLYTARDVTGTTALERMLDTLGPRGVFIMLGTGDPEYERFFTEISINRTNFLFLNNYADQLSQVLYSSGSLFLMPSSYEPCGISQMLAMREGQPCLVHAVGGLRDTVEHLHNGFSFSAPTFDQQAEQLVATLEQALILRENQPQRWQAICDAASQARFLWQDSVAAYVEQLYGGTQ